MLSITSRFCRTTSRLSSVTRLADSSIRQSRAEPTRSTASLYEYFQNRNLNAEDSVVAQSQVANGYADPILATMTIVSAAKSVVRSLKTSCSSTRCWSTTRSATGLVLPVARPPLPVTQLWPAWLGDPDEPAEFQKAVGAAQSQAGGSDLNCGATTSVLGTTIPVGDVGFAGASYTNNLTTINSVDLQYLREGSAACRYFYERHDESDTAAQIPTFWTTFRFGFISSPSANTTRSRRASRMSSVSAITAFRRFSRRVTSASPAWRCSRTSPWRS